MRRTTSRVQGRRFDWVLTALVAAVAAIGLVNLHSASLVEGTAHHLTQVVWILLGTGVAGFVATQDYRLYERLAPAIFWTLTGLLVLVLFAGVTLNGSTRWLNLGFFLMQPSEFLKIAVVLLTARHFSQLDAVGEHTLRDLALPTAMIAVPVGLIWMQPDLGTGLVILMIFGSICLFAGLRASSLAALFGTVLFSVPLVWRFVMQDYQKARVLAFLDPTGEMHENAWQVTQAKIAIGSGEWLGKGYLEGTQVQNGFVPYHENDFIFVHHAEQFGFVGGAALLALYLGLVLWSLRIARGGRDRFAVLTAAGMAAFFFWHVLINLAMVSGLLPVVGLWLPLASYGGSATLTVLLAVGILMSISMRRRFF